VYQAAVSSAKAAKIRIAFGKSILVELNQASQVFEREYIRASEVNSKARDEDLLRMKIERLG